MTQSRMNPGMLICTRGDARVCAHGENKCDRSAPLLRTECAYTHAHRRVCLCPHAEWILWLALDRMLSRLAQSIGNYLERAVRRKSGVREEGTGQHMEQLPVCPLQRSLSSPRALTASRASAAAAVKVQRSILSTAETQEECDGKSWLHYTEWL
jgi:hypothetical protein